jgi:alpha-L-rhamnosidase
MLHRLFVVFPALLVILALSSLSLPQEPGINPDLANKRWQARWIRHSESPRREFDLVHFRTAFELSSAPRNYIIHASADNRYELYVNGTRVLNGPARGDLNHWRYETMDIARYLRTGKNVLAAAVWNFAELAPMAQMTNETGLIVQGNGETEVAVNTNTSWKAFRNGAVEMIPLDRKTSTGYTVVGPGEKIDGAKYPWGWERLEFEDSGWKSAAAITEGGPRGIQDSPSRWMLVPRSIPLMEEKVERLARVVRSSGLESQPGFLQGKSPLNIPPNTKVSLLLDHEVLTTAYPELVATGGRGSVITLTYAEALWKGRTKGNRNETEGKQMLGNQDRFLPDGSKSRLFRPLWWRTFRYLQLDIQTSNEPLVIDDLRAVFTAYPFTVRASFESGDPTLKKIWDVGWRTARLCAHETYMDCPYYEQLQYVGDTRIQALVSYYVSGDDRLAKNSIELLDESRTPEGLTQSRYPSYLPQYIPPFSLLWVGMIHDLWWYRGETDFVRSILPGTRTVLQWFESHISRSELLGRLEWWNFADWARVWTGGVPPQTPDGQSAIISLQFAGALREAADLESALGTPERAQHYGVLATSIKAAARASCWDPRRRLMADTPARKDFSQHVNILAVLEDAIPVEEQKEVMQKVLTDTSLTQCTFYFRFYLFRAMKKVGLGEEYLNQLEPWRQMLALGLTTWAENPEPTRSDCHAWSAHPNFDLMATVAGIEPAAPGFAEVMIRPHLGSLPGLKASLPHPRGQIAVQYQRKGDGLGAEITLPADVSGWIVWKEKRVALRPGTQRLEF